jgi:hypothetical protein
LNHLDIKRAPLWRFGPAGQENPSSACAVPAQVLTKNEWDDPMPALLVPPKLTAEGTGNEIGDAERQAVDMHVRARLAIRILPGRGLEGQQARVRSKPVMMQSGRLMSNQPQGANS